MMFSSFLNPRVGLGFASDQALQPRPQNPQKLKAVGDLTLLNQLADIEAVRFVKQPRPELILVGPVAENGQGIQYDDWLTILRSLGQYGPPGVSIDPGPSSDEMVVHYFGGIEQTHLGSVFFEADRTLKLLSTGYDNLNCSRVSLLPASSASELEMLEQEFLKNPVAGPAGWHRFWFDLTPDEVEVSADNLSALIPPRRLFVDEQAIGPAGAGLGSGKQFAEQISRQFLDLGPKIPSFAELQRHAGLWRVAEWIADKQIPIDLRWLEAAPDPSRTATSTPTITVTRSSVSGRSYLRVGIFGGVDFRKRNSYKQSQVQSDLLQAAEQADQKGSVWDFQYSGRRYRVIRIRYQKPGPLPLATRGGGIMWERPVWDQPTFNLVPVLRWVMTVPTIDQASSELAGGVGRCGAISSSNVTLRGEAYIWDETADQVDKAALDRIPKELLANDTLKPLTVFVVYKRDKVQVGTYSISRQPAYREDLDVAMFYWPSGDCMGTTRISADPPSSRVPVNAPGYGSVKLGDWVAGLRRENR
jgi:hypothetical protein